MQIQYVATGGKRTVDDAIGAVLVKRKIAREYQTREVVEEPVVTTKRKRKYKRRDLVAE